MNQKDQKPKKSANRQDALKRETQSHSGEKANWNHDAKKEPMDPNARI